MQELGNCGYLAGVDQVVQVVVVGVYDFFEVFGVGWVRGAFYDQVVVELCFR